MHRKRSADGAFLDQDLDSKDSQKKRKPSESTSAASAHAPARQQHTLPKSISPDILAHPREDVAFAGQGSLGRNGPNGPDDVNPSSKRPKSDGAALPKDPQKKQKSSELTTSIPAYTPKPFTTPKHAYNGKQRTLPELPEILDKALEDMTFTHPGIGSHDINSYERLEFLGDAYIEVISSRIIFHRYPFYAAGKLSQKRQSLVNNETLAGFSVAYGFDVRARLPKTLQQASGKDQKKTYTKVLGDVFEAYVAAVILSNPENGFSIAESWLSKLWAPALSGEVEQEVDYNAKSQLATKIGGKHIKISYLDEAPPGVFKKQGQIVFRVGVYLTGWGWENVHLGSGKGWNKTEAGSVAAKQAIANPLTDRIAAVKRDFDLKTAQEREHKRSLEESSKA
ncbi:hypothetical protein MMC07_009073 [Pseudocyphellaria aurata]|nr:hypothetical protein [Pseudocyphellaria aurata]